MFENMTSSTLPFAPSTWKVWIEHVMKFKGICGLKRAALVRQTGVTASATPGFVLSRDDVTRLNEFFRSYGEQQDANEGSEPAGSCDRIYLRGRTFIVKSADPNQLVAFNGRKYFIISRSKSMYLVLRCDHKDRCEEAARLARTIGCMLVQKNF